MTKRERVVILGGSGFVGKHLFASLGPERSIATYNSTPLKHGVYFNAVTMSLADILDHPETISHAIILLGDTKPESCAADVQKSRAINVESIESILEQLKRWGIKPVFTSTECVFDGTTGDHVESDVPNPILTYASQKVEIERYIRDSFDEFLVLRLALTYGGQRGDGSILANWLDSIEKELPSNCAYDFVCSPIFVDDVVEGITKLMDLGANGIFHLSGHNPYSRLQMYQALLDQMKQRFSVQLEPIRCSIHDFELREKRPLVTTMKPDKFVKTTDIQVRDVKEVCKSLAAQASWPQPQG